MDYKFKREKGITIISLIITIVILLILASVTLRGLTEDDNIISSSTHAQVTTELAKLEESMETYKMNKEQEYVKQGDYGQNIDNEYLIQNSILVQMQTTEGIELGIIKEIDTFSVDLGKGGESVTGEETKSLKDLQDVYAVDLDENTIYYIKDQKVWTRDGYQTIEEFMNKKKVRIEVTPKQSGKIGRVKVQVKTLSDVILNEGNEYEYYISTMGTKLEGGEWIEYNKDGQEIEIPGDEKIYIFVKTVEDVDGNKSNYTGKKIKIGEEEYHRYGPYQSRNNIQITTDTTIADYAIKVGETTARVDTAVTVTNEGKELTDIKYAWSKDDSIEPEFTKTMTNGDTVGADLTGGTWYLWVQVTDGYGDSYVGRTEGYRVGYEIKYDTNGGSGKIQDGVKTHGEQYKISGITPTKTGYTFVGWEIESGEIYQPSGKYTEDKAVIFYAKWEVGTYTIAYDANGGTGTMQSDSVEFDTNYVVKENAFERIGHTFKGWNEQKDGTGTDWTGLIGEAYTWKKDYNVTLYAQWDVNPYTITYDYAENGGTTATKTTETLYYGDSIDLEATATKSGYTFVGWNTDKDATTGLSELTLGASDVTLYAIYSKGITLTFIDYNGTTQTTSTKTATIYNNNTATITSPTINTYTGWTSRYWTTGTEVTSEQTVANGANIVGITESATYYARYYQTVTATFIDYSGTTKTTRELSGIIETNSYAIATTTKATITTPSINAYTGWTSRYWTTGTSSTSTQTVASAGSVTISANTTYYARYYQTITITFNVNGGSGTAPSNLTGNRETNSYAISTVSNPSITMPVAISKTWYTFGGWNTNTSGTGTNYSASTAYTTLTASTTLYAKWTANPTASITTNPSAVTVVAGNSASFTVAATGNGTATYQWYYNTSNSTSGGAAVGGATSATYSFTSSTGMNGRYYYCIVTYTVGSSTKTATSKTALLTVQAANYSTVKSSVTTYYNTLAQAVTGAVTGAASTAGGTITVLNTLTDSSTVSTNKTITINTNGKTVTRTTPITTTEGTLTISGTGTIYCSADNECLLSTGGSIKLSGTPLIKSIGNGIRMEESTSGNLTIAGGYIYSTLRTPVITKENYSGRVSISNAYIYSPCAGENAFAANGNSSTRFSATITGSYIGNGATSDQGLGTDSRENAIAWQSSGTLTLSDTSVYAGPYGASAIICYYHCTINLNDDTRLYSCNDRGYYCVNLSASGCTVNFNSGYYRTAGPYALYAGSYSATLNVALGVTFTSRNNKYMFYKQGAHTATAARSSAANQTFRYMNAYNGTTTTTIGNCYTYTTGE